MTILVAAVAALGLLMIFNGVTTPSPRSVVGGGTDRLLAEAGVKGWTPAKVFLISAVLFVGTFLTIAGITAALPAAAFLAALSAYTPVAVLRHRRAQRRGALREAWPDAIATLVASVRAGVSLPEACASMQDRAPEQLREPFEVFARAYRASSSFIAALGALRNEISDPVADRVVTALRVANDVGGSDLVRVLRTLAAFVRDDVRIRKEIQARWSWTITAARVAAAAPWLVLIIMSLRPEAALAYSSAAGALVIVGGGIATFLGYRLMLRAGRLPEERRLEL
jgi:tight adherence protein B